MNKPAIIKIGYDYTTIKQDNNIICGNGTVYYYNSQESYDKSEEDSCVDFEFKYDIDKYEIFDVECDYADAKYRVETNEDDFIRNIIDNLLPQLKNDKSKEVYNSLNTIVSDIKDKKGQKIIVDLELYNDNKYIRTYNLNLDLSKMGLDRKMDYEFQMSKDLTKIVLSYYEKNKNLPNEKDIEDLMNEQVYITISLPKTCIYNEKVDRFNELCGQWDFRNIDMTEPHLAGITIKNDNSIYLTCEIYSSNLDDYISCSGGIVKSKKLVNEFATLDLDDSFAIRDFISKINDRINWNIIDEKLNKMEERELKKHNIEQEEEIEIC